MSINFKIQFCVTYNTFLILLIVCYLKTTEVDLSNNCKIIKMEGVNLFYTTIII